MGSSPCDNCKVTGLPILPIRYTVLPNTVPRRLPPGIIGKGVTDVPLTRFSYGVRIMREGWLYLFYEKGARGTNYWEAYVISELGRLRKCPMPLAVGALNPPKADACDTSIMPNRTDIIVIERPEKCGKVWIAFSEYQWHQATFDNYQKDAGLREKRMQSIQPAAWIGSGTDASGHATKANTEAIETVLEYNRGFNAEKLQPLVCAKATIDDDGGFSDERLNAVYTRYPLHIRQRTPIQATKQLLQVMSDAGANPHGAERPPMMLALWDGIGNVHELNGFRNDAGGMLTQYIAENAAKIDAMASISAAEKAVRAGAVESKSKMRSSLRAGWEAFLSSSGSGGLDGIPVTQIPSTPEEDAATQKRIADAGIINKEEAKKLGDAAWPKYEKEINRSKLNTFQTRYQTLQQATLGLQTDRATDVGAWLKAPVFLATLNDYYDKDICDGKAFEGVIAEAFLGLPSEDTGAAIVSGYFDNMDPTDSNSLIWRAFALNQDGAKAELKDLLAAANAHKSDSVNDAEKKLAPAVAEIQKLIKKMTSFVKAVKDAADRDALTERISFTERWAAKTGVDRLTITMGNAFFKWTGFGVAGEKLGTYVVKTSMLLRLGITDGDTIGLIKDAMKYDPTMKDRFDSYYKPLRAQGARAETAFYSALARMQSEEDAVDLMKQKELHLTYTNASEKLNFAKKVAGVFAIFQVISLACTVAKADKTSDDYALIVTSGLSTVSALLQVPLASMKATVGDAAKFSTFNLKAIAGVLGGVSAMISIVLDIRKFKKDASNNLAAGLVFVIKLTFSLYSTAATVITTLCFAAPFIASIVGPDKVVFLSRVRATMASLNAQAAMGKTLSGVAGEGMAEAAKARAIREAGASAAKVAVAEVGITAVSVEGAGMLLVRVALFAAGWEVMVAITIVSFAYSYFKNDDLQAWLIECPFGVSPKIPYDDIATRHAAFDKALAVAA